MSLSKETIKDNWTAFQHFINQGKVIRRSWDYEDDKYSDWCKPNDPFENESIYKSQYIIDDELVEFRKALAEGKTIQYNPKTQTHNRWDNITGTHNSILNGSVENYRFIEEIKPKYKLHTWKRDNNNIPRFIIDVTIQVKENNEYIRYTDSEYNTFLEYSLQEYFPNAGEWIWILSDKNNWVLGKFISELKEQNKIEFLTLNNNIANTIYKDIIPFKGNLPK